jgi:hypothetical protein
MQRGTACCDIRGMTRSARHQQTSRARGIADNNLSNDRHCGMPGRAASAETAKDPA